MLSCFYGKRPQYVNRQGRSNTLVVCKLCESASIDLSQGVTINAENFKPLYQALACNNE
jgi:hypothetical protein